jgi:hypothetical protein
MLLRKLIELERGKPLGVDDVMKMSYRKGLRYLDYDHIGNKTLKQLLPTRNSGLLILFTDHRSGSKKIGHFCLLFRNERSGLTFWDPYGLGLRNVTKVTKSRKKLQELLKGHDFHNNKIAYQVREGDVNTCGRHCATRWNAAQLHANEYEDLMHDPRLDSDHIVLLMTIEHDLTKLKLKK